MIEIAESAFIFVLKSELTISFTSNLLFKLIIKEEKYVDFIGTNVSLMINSMYSFYDND